MNDMNKSVLRADWNNFRNHDQDENDRTMSLTEFKAYAKEQAYDLSDAQIELAFQEADDSVPEGFSAEDGAANGSLAKREFDIAKHTLDKLEAGSDLPENSDEDTEIAEDDSLTTDAPKVMKKESNNEESSEDGTPEVETPEVETAEVETAEVETAEVNSPDADKKVTPTAKETDPAAMPATKVDATEVDQTTAKPVMDPTLTEGNSNAEAAKEWDELMNSGEPIDAIAIENKPALAKLIETELGFSDSTEFVAHVESIDPAGVKSDVDANYALVRNFRQFGFGAFPLTPSGKQEADTMLSTVFESKPISLDGKSSAELDAIPDSQTSVTLETEKGPVVFTGVKAGKVAKDFVNLYENSPTFKNSFDAHSEQHGLFTFRSVNPPSELVHLQGAALSANSMTIVPNIVTDGIAELRGQEYEEIVAHNNEEGTSGAHIIMHEFVHNLIDGDTRGENGEPIIPHEEGVEGHHRDHSLYMGAVWHELNESGQMPSTEGMPDTVDYSDDALVFRSDRLRVEDQQDYNEIREKHGEDYEKVKGLLNQTPPDIQAAAKMLDTLDVEMDVTVEEASNGKPRTISMNVKDLMLQEMVLESNRSDVFGTSDTPVSKKAVGDLVRELEKNGEGQRMNNITASILVPLDEVTSLA